MIEFKDITFEAARLIAFSKGYVPGTEQQKGVHTVALFLEGYPQPLIVGFDTLEERDDSYVLLGNTIETIHTGV